MLDASWGLGKRTLDADHQQAEVGLLQLWQSRGAPALRSRLSRQCFWMMCAARCSTDTSIRRAHRNATYLKAHSHPYNSTVSVLTSPYSYPKECSSTSVLCCMGFSVLSVGLGCHFSELSKRL